MPNDLLIKNVRPMGGAPCDVQIRNGTIERIGPGLAPAPEKSEKSANPESGIADSDTPNTEIPNMEIIEGGNALLIPSLVDGHMHLDKTLLGLPWVPHQAGPTTFDRIESEKTLLRTMTLSVEDQAAKLIRLAIAKGTARIRSHVDIDPELGLSRLEALLAVREKFAGAIDMQLVSCPQQGVLRRPGTVELLEDALRAGADLIGGIDPAGLDEDAAGQLNALFAIAERRGVGLDVHLHDPGELGVHQIGLIAERTRAHGLAGKVAISHAYCLGSLAEPRIGRAVETLAECGISIMTTGAAHSPVPPLQRLHDGGVTVFSGSDGVRDAWTPFGNADMLERAMLVALRYNFRTDEGLGLAFNTATRGGARALSLAGYGLEAGCAGDLVLLECETVPEAIVTRPVRKWVVKGGRVVAREGEALV